MELELVSVFLKENEIPGFLTASGRMIVTPFAAMAIDEVGITKSKTPAGNTYLFVLTMESPELFEGFREFEIFC